jgi:hypothetical protein
MKTLEKQSSQYPSKNDLVKQLLVTKQQHDVNFDFTYMPLVIHLTLSISQPVLQTHKVNVILEHIMIVTCYAHLISMARISENQ